MKGLNKSNSIFNVHLFIYLFISSINGIIYSQPVQPVHCDLILASFRLIYKFCCFTKSMHELCVLYIAMDNQCSGNNASATTTKHATSLLVAVSATIMKHCNIKHSLRVYLSLRLFFLKCAAQSGPKYWRLSHSCENSLFKWISQFAAENHFIFLTPACVCTSVSACESMCMFVPAFHWKIDRWKVCSAGAKKWKRKPLRCSSEVVKDPASVHRTERVNWQCRKHIFLSKAQIRLILIGLLWKLLFFQ